MTIEVKMPALSPTMEKGVLAKWLVAAGDKVRPGDVLAEVETDKATMEVEAIDEGRIASLVIAEGTDDVPVGTVIALISSETADVGAAPPASRPAVIESLPKAEQAAAPPPPPQPQQPLPRVSAAPDDEISATPLARRIAAANGISLKGIVGTGGGGRIVKADLGLDAPPIPAASLSPANRSLASSAPSPLRDAAPALFAPPPSGVPVETVRLSGMRKTIARRLTEAKQSIPHFYLSSRCVLDRLLKLRGELNAELQSRGVKVSVNDMLLKAMALAMKAVPDCNVQFGGDVMHRFTRVDIAMAVAIEGGLVTPVVKDAGALSISAIAEIGQALAARARAGELAPEDYQGGTASLSNLGMFGIEQIVPVINPPQALILGIGAGIEQPWKVDGEIRLATLLTATGSFDHRAIDGATGARFMAAFGELVEHPLSILG